MAKFVNWLTKYNKAITAAVVTAAFKWFEVKGNGVTADEWKELIIATLIAGGATWAIPNNKPKVQDDRDKV